MPENWDDWRAFANEMIADSGFAATLRKKGAVAGGVPRGLRTQHAPRRRTWRWSHGGGDQPGIRGRPQHAPRRRPQSVRRQVVLFGDGRGPEKAMPEDGDTLAVRGRDLKIIRVDTTAPGGVDVVYLVHTER